MWYLTHGNTNMNRFERLMEHRGHLERLAQTKTVLNTKAPETPSFISKKMIEPGSRMERALKIKNDNANLYWRLKNIMNKTSPYNQINNIPSKCPAFELLSYHRLKKNKNIKKVNNKLHNRYVSAKSTYNPKKFENDYEYSKYLQSNISQNRNYINPNLNFVSFKTFNKTLFETNTNKNSSTNNSIDYEGSYFPTQKFNNSKYNKNEEWFKNNQSMNNKLKRPNSCKPNIFIPDVSKFSDNIDKYNNISIKTYGTKPASGRTRVNGSGSTNLATMFNSSH